MPYATDTEAPARPLAPVEVRVGERVYTVVVSDAEVREGAIIDVAVEARE